jgi:hypothetical protein
MRYLSTLSLALIVHVLLSIVVLMALACTSSDSKMSATIQAAISDAETAEEWERERGEKFIWFVIDHIERGVPIQYMESRLVEGYSSEEVLKDLGAAAASGNYDQYSAKHEEDYLWSEDEQCHAWHQGEKWHLAQGIEWEKHDLWHPAYFHWRASFHSAEEWKREVEQHPELEKELEVESAFSLIRNIMSSDHWRVIANLYENSCYWLVSDDGDAIYAATRFNPNGP